MKKNNYNRENENLIKNENENIVKSAVHKVGKTTIDTGATVLGVTAGFVAAGAIIKVAGKAIDGVKNIVTNKLASKKATDEVDEITEDEILCEAESDVEEDADNE